MSILTSTAETVEFTVPWRVSDPTAPKFRFRAGSVIERGQMEAELSGVHNAGRVAGFELRQATRKGVQTLFANDPDLDRLLAIVEAEGEGEPNGLSEEDQLLVPELHKLLNEHWPEYRDLIARANRRREIAPIVALKRFCVGIEGIGNGDKPIVFARGRDGTVAESTLVSLDSMEMLVAGNRCYALQYGIGEEAEKNSELPPASAGGPEISPSASTSKGGGKSTATAGKKTPASPRRRGRSR